MSLPRLSIVGVIAVLAALTLSACAGDPSAQPVSASNNAGAGGVTPLGDANESPKTHRPEAPAQLVVTNVRVGTHDGFDRVVFDLAGNGQPGWFVDYTSTPTRQGSGAPVKVSGQQFLNVNIDGTVAPHEIGLSDPGLGRIDGVGNIVEVVNAGGFDGRSQFVVGLQHADPYSVQILEDPLRLVVDIVH